MTKQEQIEEMTKLINSKEIYPCEDDVHCENCFCADKDTAEKLYNAGYRKTFTNEMVSDTQKAFKEGYEKGCEACAQSWDNGYNDGFEDGKEQAYKDCYDRTRKETAKEIYERLIELSENPCNGREEIYKTVFEKYGVEMEE